MNQTTSTQRISPFWLRTLVLTALVLFVLLWIKLWAVIAPFLAAFILAYLLNPLIHYLSKHGVSRQFSIVTVIAGGMALIVAVIVLLVPPLITQVGYLQENWPQIINWINASCIPWVQAHFGVQLEPISASALKGLVLDYASEEGSAQKAGSALAWVAKSGVGMANVIGMLVLVPIITLYLLWGFDSLATRFERWIPMRHRNFVMNLMLQCHQALGAFVKGQLAVMTALGVIYAVGLQIAGLNLGLLVGLISGLASIVPYVGFAVGLSVSVVVALIQNGLDPSFLLKIAAVFLIGQLLEGYVLQPKLLGSSIGLSPVLVIFAVLAGASLMGFVGMMLSLPVAAVLMVLLGRAKEAYLRSEYYKATPEQRAEQLAASHAGEVKAAATDSHGVETGPGGSEPAWLIKLKASEPATFKAEAE